MSEEPISQIVFHVKKECLNDIETLAGLDRGCTLTKLVYVPKSQPTNEAGDYLLTCALYPNSQFEAALQWLKKEALLPEKGHFHVTGAGGVNFKTLISETLGLEIVFVDECLCLCRGAHFLVNNLDEQEITYPRPEVDVMKVEHSESFQKVQEKVKEKHLVNETDKGKFPFLFVILGSASGILQIEEDGSYKYVQKIPFGGKTFIGLARCLLQTTVYDEILDLAAKGNRGAVDTQIYEIIDDKSPYGNFPPDLPVFPFGKAADRNIGMETFEKSDVARSLVSFATDDILHSVLQACMHLPIKSVYIGGHMFKSETFREEMETLIKIWQMPVPNLQYLKTGNTSAIGAMISKPGDEKKYFTV